MYKLLLFSILFIFGTTIYVQSQEAAPGLIWQKTLGGSSSDRVGYLDTNSAQRPKVCLPDKDGGYIIGGDVFSNDGNISGNHGNTDYWVAKLDAQRKILWSTCLGGSYVDNIASVQLGAGSGYIVTGTTASGDGDVTGTLGFTDIWVVRLGSNGKIVWKKCYGGSVVDEGSYIGKTTNGYVLLGTTSSNDRDVSGLHGNSDIWIASLDTAGSILWQKCLGGSGDDRGVMVKQTADSGFIVTGTTNSIDGDVQGGRGSNDIWVVKLDKNGAIQWQKCLGGSDDESPCDIEITKSGDYIVGGMTSSINGDVSGHHGPPYSYDAWLVSLSATGTLQWQKCFGGNETEGFADVQVLPDNSLIAAGYTGSHDGDVSYQHGYHDVWLLKINNTGNKVWEKTFGGSAWDDAASVAVKPNGNIVVLGTTYSWDMDVSGKYGQDDIWLFEAGAVNTIAGYVFLDANKDGKKNSNEPFFNEVTVRSQKGSQLESTIPVKGYYSIRVDTGTFSTQAVPYNNYYTIVPAVKNSTFNTFLNTDSVHFAIQPKTGIRDLTVSLAPNSPARIGFPVQYVLFYKNVGTDTLASGTISFVRDARFDLINSSQSFKFVKGDTIGWSISNLYPGTGGSIVINLKLRTFPATKIGDTVSSIAWFDQSNKDFTPADDTSKLKQIATASFDPNDKTEANAGVITPAQLANNEYLNYVIRFQNTGNDTAFNITVTDTLESRVDWSSLQMTGASHPYQLSIKNNNILTWQFDNIRLPDSIINEPLSHGFIAFRIKPVSTVAIGDTIKNAAAIYFDFNPPVLTSPQLTIVRVAAPAQPVISGLMSNYCNNQGSQKIKILNLPDNTITKTVTLDNITPLTIASDSSCSFTVSALTAGTHSIVVTFSNSGGSKTTTANFTVNEAVTPDVNVTANITLVTNLTTPVVITATNASGGGKTPLYTFSWNRTFTNIIQNESSTTTVSITPSALAIGDNTVYVRMKTSETCYTTQTNIDSITIRRDQATGIIDADNPGQVINIYPNPFNGPVTIDGLSTAKTYVVSVSNLNGQIVYSKRVTNRSTIDINRLKDANGVYWLSVYDEKKKRLLGSIKLLKK
jgi:uncharacterized repeat protein (TIGR01451 family)